MLHPQGVRGPWKAGIVLDWHTVECQVIGENEFGHPIFDTQRSEIGELLYRFHSPAARPTNGWSRSRVRTSAYR
jgi:hypothetical protein